MNMERIFFILFAGMAVIGALNLLLRRNPLHSALSLLATMAALTGLYVMLGAQFIAVIQVLIYAGAVLVLFLFVIMLLNARTEETRLDRWPYLKWLAIPFAALLIGQILYIIRLFRVNPVPVGTELGFTESVGRRLFSTYLLPFEATSILILVAIIGAVVLAKRD
jgi:NADH-quinone oxidoreductase subunit J